MELPNEDIGRLLHDFEKNAIVPDSFIKSADVTMTGVEPMLLAMPLGNISSELAVKLFIYQYERFKKTGIIPSRIHLNESMLHELCSVPPFEYEYTICSNLIYFIDTGIVQELHPDTEPYITLLYYITTMLHHPNTFQVLNIKGIEKYIVDNDNLLNYYLKFNRTENREMTLLLLKRSITLDRPLRFNAHSDFTNPKFGEQIVEIPGMTNELILRYLEADDDDDDCEDDYIDNPAMQVAYFLFHLKRYELTDIVPDYKGRFLWGIEEYIASCKHPYLSLFMGDISQNASDVLKFFFDNDDPSEKQLELLHRAALAKGNIPTKLDLNFNRKALDAMITGIPSNPQGYLRLLKSIHGAHPAARVLILKRVLELRPRFLYSMTGGSIRYYIHGEYVNGYLTRTHAEYVQLLLPKIGGAELTRNQFASHMLNFNLAQLKKPEEEHILRQSIESLTKEIENGNDRKDYLLEIEMKRYKRILDVLEEIKIYNAEWKDRFLYAHYLAAPDEYPRFNAGLLLKYNNNGLHIPQEIAKRIGEFLSSQ